MTKSSSPERLWDVLVCSIEERTAMLGGLLSELGRQMQPDVGVIVCRDNLEASYGSKCQRLIEASHAEYVSFVDDDDWIHRGYMALIVQALHRHPDYVGFRVKITEDDEPQIPASHSLAHGTWRDTPSIRYRGISHLNPIRRDLALLGNFESATTLVNAIIDGRSVTRREHGGLGAERVWAEAVRCSGRCLREVFLDGELYHYRHSSSNGFLAPRAPLAQLQPRPEGFDHFVTWI